MSLWPLVAGGCRQDGHTFPPEVGDHLIAKYAVRSIVDIGCGYGFSTKCFLDKGLGAIGIEGFRPALDDNKCPRQYLMEHHYTVGPLRVAAPTK